jgi:hypothetical protein
MTEVRNAVTAEAAKVLMCSSPLLCRQVHAAKRHVRRHSSWDKLCFLEWAFRKSNSSLPHPMHRLKSKKAAPTPRREISYCPDQQTDARVFPFPGVPRSGPCFRCNVLASKPLAEGTKSTKPMPQRAGRGSVFTTSPIDCAIEPSPRTCDVAIFAAANRYTHAAVISRDEWSDGARSKTCNIRLRSDGGWSSLCGLARGRRS